MQTSQIIEALESRLKLIKCPQVEASRVKKKEKPDIDFFSLIHYAMAIYVDLHFDS